MTSVFPFEMISNFWNFDQFDADYLLTHFLHNFQSITITTTTTTWPIINLYFLNMGQPRPLLRLFSTFQSNITISTTNKCEKCPSSKRRWDSNPRPLEHESPPITTRPGLPPNKLIFLWTGWKDCKRGQEKIFCEFVFETVQFVMIFKRVCVCRRASSSITIKKESSPFWAEFKFVFI